MSDQIDREAALREFGVVCATPCHHDSCNVRRRVAAAVRALPAAVPVVDVEKACAEIRMNIVYWEDKHGQDEDIMPFARAIVDAALGRGE